MTTVELLERAASYIYEDIELCLDNAKCHRAKTLIAHLRAEAKRLKNKEVCIHTIPVYDGDFQGDWHPVPRYCRKCGEAVYCVYAEEEPAQPKKPNWIDFDVPGKMEIVGNIYEKVS